LTARKSAPAVLQLRRSLGVAEKEVRLLEQTRERLFRGKESVDAAWVRRVADDVELSERLEAFSSRFSRLQDTVMDKLLPRVLAAAGEAIGSAIDNLNRADRLGLVQEPDEWIALRQLRNRLVHEYMEDAEEFSTVLNQVVRLSAELIKSVERVRQYAEDRFGKDLQEVSS
jgi:uncharacterized protein with HEPN domain